MAVDETQEHGGDQGSTDIDVPDDAPARRRRVLPWILSVTLGMLLGSSLFVLSYAKGLSYFSNDPASCANCHIMQPLYDTWQRSPHAAVATCNDCHTPHEFVRKYISKARNGWNHSVAFTLQNFDEPIQIKPFNAVILEENCRTCHEDLVNQITGHYGSHDQEPDCVRCHRDVGHAFSR